MSIGEYCGEFEFSILQLIISLSNDINEKIKQKRLFYKEQIDRYINKQIDLFFVGKHLNKGLVRTYKSDVYNSIMLKIRNSLKEHKIFQCL